MNAILPVTAVYAAFLALVAVLLMLVVVRLRRQLKVGIGDGGSKALSRAIRVHANALENIPLFVILLALFELNGGNAYAAHALGVAFLLARVAHAAGMLRTAGASMGRVLGTGLTVTCLVVLAVLNLVQAVSK
jgi:hypothetical protein